MLDAFLEVSYNSLTKKQATYELTQLMTELPGAELRKIAAGTPLGELYGYLDKTASMCGPDGQPLSFLDKFKGSPLFEQAVALEQQELQAEMADMQKRQERRQMNASDDSFYDVRDRIRVQKRLLELELAKQESGAAGAPAGPPMAAPPLPEGAPPMPPPAPMAADPAVKMASAQKVAFAENMGRLLARSDMEKAAHVNELESVGARAGAAMSKMAFAMPTGALGTAARWAVSHPGSAGALAGGAVGAAGGAAAGGPGNRLAGAAGGAAAGAAIGGMGAGTLGRMHAGQTIGTAATNTARSGFNTVARGVGQEGRVLRAEGPHMPAGMIAPGSVGATAPAARVKTMFQEPHPGAHVATPGRTPTHVDSPASAAFTERTPAPMGDAGAPSPESRAANNAHLRSRLAATAPGRLIPARSGTLVSAM